MTRFRLFVITIHIAGWLLFMAFPLLFLNRDGQVNQWLILSLPSYWFFCITYIALFYINGYLLIPYFFLKKKYLSYAAIAFVLLSCVYIIRPFGKLLRTSFGDPNRMQMQGRGFQFNGLPPGDMHQPFVIGNHHGSMSSDGHRFPGGHHGPGDFGPGPVPLHWRVDSTSLFIFFMIMAISTAIKTVQQWQLTEQRAARAEADKASAELSFLKAQINPHFLFNTLNNIYTLAITKDDNAGDSIMKLSNIMRYVTDDVAVDFVALQSEIDCISDYIELQLLRMNENTPVDFKVIGDASGKKYPR